MTPSRPSTTSSPRRCLPPLLFAVLCATPAGAQSHSVARQWNDALLDAIRLDLARPTVHARNLFHTAVAFYDAWAAYSTGPERTYLLGNTVEGFTCGFDGVDPVADRAAARDEAVSYAAYRLLRHRFAGSPGAAVSLARFDSLFAAQGYDAAFVEQSDPAADPAQLGNYLASCLIDFGLLDGANEAGGYESLFYEPVNEPFAPDLTEAPVLADPNRWQPLSLDAFVDQSGNLLDASTPGFLSPEWGHVIPFALDPAQRVTYHRDGHPYPVYHDPGPPPTIDSFDYRWGFALVAVWSGHLDPADGVMIDISPASIGNIPFDQLPATAGGYPAFYDLLDGGDPSPGHDVNPHTGQPYAPQIVPRGDYARVLAEFWADGPDSETPPGHWFTILNYVNDHPLFERRYRGDGPVLDPLEWDVRAYLALGGAVHDAAVAAWGIKGWYDYVRPVSAIRYMASLGQSSGPDAPSYHPHGIPLVPGHIELIEAGDPLAGFTGGNVGRIKLYAWRGPRLITDPATDEAGVGWILAESWWPYQRPTFVTPPFAGYVSGHSTFSRAAAEVMTLLTGDAFFPGGLGEFHAPRDAFLVFEDGPSVDIVLQWATYRDASEQTSLSRIWGGIHPPVDDIPGRLIGRDIGVAAFHAADRLFQGDFVTSVEELAADAGDAAGAGETAAAALTAWPNPLRAGAAFSLDVGAGTFGHASLYNIAGQRLRHRALHGQRLLRFDTAGLAPGLYFAVVESAGQRRTARLLLVK